MEDCPVNRRLNVLFITQEDPFYIRVFFEEFLRNYHDTSEIKGIVICSTLGRKSLKQLAQRMYDLYGPIGVIRMGLRYIAAKALGAVSTFIRTGRSYSLRQLLDHYGIYAERRDDINSPSFLRKWKRRNIDVIVSVAAPKIFKKDLLELPRWGCVNIHHAKLPHYRGMMPNFWQMYHGEKTAGITVHKMNPRIDEGEIILQRETLIGANESLDGLIKRTKRMGARCVIETLELIQNNSVVYQKNCPEKGGYFTFPTRAQAREFRHRGKRLL